MARADAAEAYVQVKVLAVAAVLLKRGWWVLSLLVCWYQLFGLGDYKLQRLLWKAIESSA